MCHVKVTHEAASLAVISVAVVIATAAAATVSPQDAHAVPIAAIHTTPGLASLADPTIPVRQETTTYPRAYTPTATAAVTTGTPFATVVHAPSDESFIALSQHPDTTRNAQVRLAATYRRAPTVRGAVCKPRRDYAAPPRTRTHTHSVTHAHTHIYIYIYIYRLLRHHYQLLSRHRPTRQQRALRTSR
jgi:hypothetical protein